MTSKVIIICNGPSYVVDYTKHANDIQIEQGQLRGGDKAQSCMEVYLGQDQTITVTERHSPLDAQAPT